MRKDRRAGDSPISQSDCSSVAMHAAVVRYAARRGGEGGDWVARPREGRVMPHVVVTGGPGTGKTTLLAELASRGYAIVEDSARAIIAERLGRGETARPDALGFAREIFRRDLEKYLDQPRSSRWVFFDRGLIDALGLLHEASALPSGELTTILTAYPFHPTVFVLPPWEAIYANDAERDQSFAEAVHVHTKVVEWYRACGYVLDEVPRLPVAQRAAHVLGVLDQHA